MKNSADSNTKPLVLCVNSDESSLRMVKYSLSDSGIRLIVSQNCDDAMVKYEKQRPDLIISDVVFPHQTVQGGEFLRNVRERSFIPFIFLSTLRSDKDKVLGLEIGADDYIVIPFDSYEFVARIRAVIRRSIGTVGPIKIGCLNIDIHLRRMYKDGKLVELTRTEWLLLQVLASNQGKLMQNEEILTKVWGPEYVDDLQYLRVWVSRLRNKLEPNPGKPVYLLTSQGIGYRFTDEVKEDCNPSLMAKAV